MQIFQLKSLEIGGCRRNCNNGHKVYEADLGLYGSREKAEEAMRRLIKENQWSTFFAFFIYERELNPCLDEEGYGYQGVTSYYPDGTLYCESPYDVSCKKIFRGRPAETIKLKVGDLAWFWRGDTIEPCLVFATPCTTEEYAAICQKNGVDPQYDYSDDCYGVYNYGHNHDHPYTWCLFPFTGKITQRNMERLLETQKWWDDGCPLPAQASANFLSVPK